MREGPSVDRAQLSGTPAGRMSGAQITVGTLHCGQREAPATCRTVLGSRKTILLAE